MKEFQVRRIVVGLDGSEHSLAALGGAVELAARLHAEVHGLFVEDTDLLRLGGLPCVRELRLPSGTPRALVSGTIEGELAALAARARRALMHVAERLHVTWSFRVQRGSVARLMLAAAAESDLLMLGWASRPLSTRVRLGSVALAAVKEGAGPVLLCRRGQAGMRSLVLVYEGALAAPGAAGPTVMDRALSCAVLLMEVGMESLTVLVQGQTVEEVRSLERRVTGQLSRVGIAARVRPVIDREARSATVSDREARSAAVSDREAPGERSTALALCHAVQRELEGLVVLGRGSQLLGLLDELGCPVLVIR